MSQKAIPINLKNRHKEILALIRENRKRLFLAMGCMLVISACTALSAYLVKPVLDYIFFEQNAAMLKTLPVIVILIWFFRGLGYYGQEYLMNYVGEVIIRRLRDRLYFRIQDLPVSFFYKEQTGVLMSRITNDVNIIKEMVSKSVTSSLRDVFTIMGLIVVIFYMDWKMAIFALIILPAAFYPVVEFGRRVRRISTGCQEAMAELSSFLHETFVGNKIVKAFSMEEHEKKRFAEKTGALFKMEMRSVVAKSLSSPIMEFLAGIGIAFIIWYGGARVIEGKSTPGTFFSFLTAVLMLYDPVKKLTRLNNAIQQGLAATDRVFDILERENPIRDPENPVSIGRKPHSVSFEAVYLSYGDEYVLQDINLFAEPGEIIALVGMSGGGKTSLVNLIPRFYDVSKGAVKIDGTDIRDLRLASLRDQIAIVTQDTILFNDTIRNNIAYGNQKADFSEIRAAAQAAYAHEFIMKMPEGYDTSIGELGGRLSGGERQRVCIARALLKDAPILILDEATSSLDTESEMLVQKALENLMKGRTTFVIAHRLSTIGYANLICVIVKGEIVEIGKHEELLEKKGAYYKLFRMQFGNRSSEEE